MCLRSKGKGEPHTHTNSKLKVKTKGFTTQNETTNQVSLPIRTFQEEQQTQTTNNVTLEMGEGFRSGFLVKLGSLLIFKYPVFNHYNCNNNRMTIFQDFNLVIAKPAMKQDSQEQIEFFLISSSRRRL